MAGIGGECGMKRWRLAVIVCWGVGWLIGWLIGSIPSVAIAGGMDVKQVRIAAKVFSFLQKKPPPGAIIIVLSGAADPALLATTLQTFKISEGHIPDVAGAVAVFVNSTAEAAAVKSINPRILIIGTDLGCVDAHACIVAVETIPRISVYLSRAAASSAGIDFDTSFKMLVTER